jgi:hypothetical protein
MTPGVGQPSFLLGSFALDNAFVLIVVRRKAVPEKPPDANVERAASKLVAGINKEHQAEACSAG